MRLCLADSDGDGWSNGEELGDPDCTWTRGSIPQRTFDITHPGNALILLLISFDTPVITARIRRMGNYNRSNFNCVEFCVRFIAMDRETMSSGQ